MSSDETIRIHERLSCIETMLSNIAATLEEQNQYDLKIDEKIDKILNNDKDKLMHLVKLDGEINTLKNSLKYIKYTLYIFLAPICAALAKWFV